MVKSMDISFACSTFSLKQQAETVHVTAFTSDCSLTLSFSLHRVVHVLGQQWLEASHCMLWAARWWVSQVFLWHVSPTQRPDLIQKLAMIGWQTLICRVLTLAPCACCVNLYVCMHKVILLGVFEYFLSLYYFVSIFLSFQFFISKKSCSQLLIFTSSVPEGTSPW